MKEKRVIKRYRNRKLYDMVDSCYVTLEDIAELIRNGENVCIIENSTGEDMTSVTLAQIILDEERRKKEVLPLNTFFELIRSSGETIKDFAIKSIGGGVKEFSHVRDGISEHLEGWINRGAISPDEGSKFITNIKKFVESKVKNAVENVQNISSMQSDVKDLKQKITNLEKEIKPTKKKPIKKKK